MTSHAQRIFFLALTSMAGASALQAQQTNAPPINQTPPELRDFRLDPPAPAAQGPEQRPPLPSERPATAPPVAQPPASQPGSSEPATGTARRETADPAPASRERDIETTANRNARGAPSADEGASEPQDSAAPTAPPASAPPPPSAETAPSATETDAWWPWIVGGLALLTALIAIAVFARRQSRSVQPSLSPKAESNPAPLAERARRPAPAPPQQPAPCLALLSASFTAENAQLSIASLTVTGTLKIRNEGSALLTGARLRSLMISAQEGQEDTAAAFHNGGLPGDAQPLGDLAPGEQIDARLEFRLPRNELASFRWSEREFVAPILLINLRADRGGDVQEIRLSQLIGRAAEGDVATERLKPLAIDRGPRRYPALAAKAIFA